MTIALERPGVRIDRTIALAGLLLAVHIVVLVLQYTESFRPNIDAMIVESVVYGAAVLLVGYRRSATPLWFVLAVAVVLRLSVLPFHTYHSTDIYRYIWDGRVQAAGINPYLYIPNDPVLAPLRDTAIWPGINRADYAHTIYPPVTEMIFFLATRISESILWMKIVFVAIEAAGIWGLLRLLDLEGLPRQRILIYAWCPLPVWEIAGSGHLDAAMLTFVILSILALRQGRMLMGGAVLGLATLVKFFPLLLLPALWRRWDWRLPTALVAVIVLGYLTYIGAGPAVLGFLYGYSGEEGLRDGSGFWILVAAREITGLALPTFVYLAGAAAILGVLALVVMSRPSVQERVYTGGLMLALTGMVALAPEYPWYFAWLVPFLCFKRSLPAIWILASAYLLYWDNARYVPWIDYIVYGGAILLGVTGFGRRWFVPHAATWSLT